MEIVGPSVGGTPQARKREGDVSPDVPAITDSNPGFKWQPGLLLCAAAHRRAEAPHLDEDYLILATIHSAKDQEWRAVFVLNVVDGCILSDMSVGSAKEIEEERRLLYVAMTRAKRHLHLVHPGRFYRAQQHRLGDGHVFAPLTRFIPEAILDRFDRRQWPLSVVQGMVPLAQTTRVVDVAARMRKMWR